MAFDLAGHALLEARSLPADRERVLIAGMDPFSPATPGSRRPDVVVEAVEDLSASGEVQGRGSDDLVTATVGDQLAILRGDACCLLPDFAAGTPWRFAISPGFPIDALLRTGVLPALQLAVLEHEATTVHASAVALGDGALVIAGWSESGKTETALALMERHGARFISDKWTLLGEDGRASAFPIGLGVRRWVLDHLPRLKREVGPLARTQFAAARGASGVAALLRRTRDGTLIHRLAEPAAGFAAMADRAAFTPSRIRTAYGDLGEPLRSLPVRATILLRTAPQGRAPVVVADTDAGALARRLAVSGAFERRAFYALEDRRRYALALEDRRLAHLIEAREEARLGRCLDGVACFEVHAPFPTDPTTVADAIVAGL